MTQIVLGAAVGEAVLGKKAGNRAMFYGAVAGTIPDLDALAGCFTDPVTAIEIHRSFTHSVVFALLTSPVFGWLISLIEGQTHAPGWKDWSKLMFWGLFTHSILDCFTTWGTQLFWPFQYEVSLRSVFVIDPLYTLPLLICLLLALRKKKTDSRRRILVHLGFLISTAYLLLGLIFKGIAYNNFKESLERQGIFYDRMDTRPSPFNIILWNANVEVKDAFLLGEYSLFDDQLIRFEAYPKNHEYLGILKHEKKVRRLVEITDGWYSISSEDGQLYFNDLRFGKLDPSDPDSNFTFSYKLKPTKKGIVVEEVEKRPEDAAAILTYLWERIKGN